MKGRTGLRARALWSKLRAKRDGPPNVEQTSRESAPNLGPARALRPLPIFQIRIDASPDEAKIEAVESGAPPLRLIPRKAGAESAWQVHAHDRRSL